MEGDVMMVGSNLPVLIGISCAVLGGVFALLKWFAARLLADIEGRLERIDDLEARYERLMAELPLHYQRREDAIRELALVDDRYQKIVDGLIASLRREVGEANARIESIEKAREAERMTYQLRDDAIREYTAVNAKLDRIWEALIEVRNGR